MPTLSRSSSPSFIVWTHSKHARTPDCSTWTTKWSVVTGKAKDVKEKYGHAERTVTAILLWYSDYPPYNVNASVANLSSITVAVLVAGKNRNEGPESSILGGLLKIWPLVPVRTSSQSQRCVKVICDSSSDSAKPDKHTKTLDVRRNNILVSNKLCHPMAAKRYAPAVGHLRW